VGQEIDRTRFEPEDYIRFGACLAEETALLAEQEHSGQLSDECCQIGFEVEAWLVDRYLLPAPRNVEFLAALDSPLVVPELSRFNVELNGTPQPLRGQPFARLEAELTSTWRHCLDSAHDLGCALVLVGILPTVREQDLNMANMSPLKRYRALNEQILQLRGGRPLHVDIHGDEHLHTRHGDVMLEAATTSFQVHLQVPAVQAARYYNASLIASAPVLAASVNSPFLFEHSLWAETRIPLFEQAVASHAADARPHEGRVNFGNGYLADGVATLFEENRARFPVLLPMVTPAKPGTFSHLRLHNGTIWRWNRPLIGFNRDGRTHIRIEHRVLPAGPSILDMIANAAFYTGLAEGLAHRTPAPELDIDFDTARENFYRAARLGLDAGIRWPGTAAVDACSLILEKLLPLARAGLLRLGIDVTEIERTLGVIEARVRSRQTGAAWQRAWVIAHGRDFRLLTATYLENQRSGAPVHEWLM